MQELAAKAAELTGQNERAILEVLMQREKLGSTAVGNGIAIPHGKLPKLDKLFGLFARLGRPIDFEALDGQPVDLIFLLLAPEGAGADHLKALARVARLLRDAGRRQQAAAIGRRRGALCRADHDARGRLNHSAGEAWRTRGLAPAHHARLVHADRLELVRRALAIAASRLSVTMIGVPSAACSANSLHAGREVRRLWKQVAARPRNGSPSHRRSRRRRAVPALPG